MEAMKNQKHKKRKRESVDENLTKQKEKVLHNSDLGGDDLTEWDIEISTEIKEPLPRELKEDKSTTKEHIDQDKAARQAAKTEKRRKERKKGIDKRVRQWDNIQYSSGEMQLKFFWTKLKEAYKKR